MKPTNEQLNEAGMQALSGVILTVGDYSRKYTLPQERTFAMRLQNKLPAPQGVTYYQLLTPGEIDMLDKILYKYRLLLGKTTLTAWHTLNLTYKHNQQNQ